MDPSDHQKLAPIGTVGELVVEGPNIARGYLKDEAKTTASFISHPRWLPDCNTRPDSRLYKMGDLVRYLPDGKVHFVGRKDGQVKLRGQRIELGEIEQKLRDCVPELKEFAVEMVRPAASGDGTSPKAQLLAAFMSLDTETVRAAGLDVRTLGKEERGIANSAEERDYFERLVGSENTGGLRDLLARLLPAHMIPSVFIPLRQMPLTASAKTDRNVLRRYISDMSVQILNAFSNAVTASASVVWPPETPVEFQMQALWAETLDVDVKNIGRWSNFVQVSCSSN